MKKKISFLIAALLVCAILAACGSEASAGGYQFFDTTFTFGRAMIAMPDGTTVEGKVSSWKDYENSDQIQLVINNITYLTHISNVVLINE